MVMNYEEKYKQALERARYYYSKDYMLINSAIENIFPELKESKGEQIKKWLIGYFKQYKADGMEKFANGLKVDNIVAWLEKQKAQEQESKQEPKFKVGDKVLVKSESITKPVICTIEEVSKFNTYWLKYKDGGSAWWSEDELEPYIEHKSKPKFKVGDWCIDNEDGVIFQIVKVLDNTYTYKTNEGKEYSCTHYSLENDTKLWTIRDAQDGDVLVDSYSKDSIIILYKGIYKERSILAHCGWNGYNFSVKTNGLGYGALNNTNYLPATKEQCDLLFQKIKEADYEWNSEKKELKKIKVASKESENERIKKEIIDFFELPHPQFVGKRDQEEWLAWIKKQGEQKQTWKPTTAQLIVIKDLIEDKNTSKVNKVILRGMFDEFKQCFGL